MLRSPSPSPQPSKQVSRKLMPISHQRFHLHYTLCKTVYLTPLVPVPDPDCVLSTPDTDSVCLSTQNPGSVCSLDQILTLSVCLPQTLTQCAAVSTLDPACVLCH